MTQEEFAAFLGVTRNYISMLELGVRKPSRKLVCRLEALGANKTIGSQMQNEPSGGASGSEFREKSPVKRISYLESLDFPPPILSDSLATTQQSDAMLRPPRAIPVSRPFHRLPAAELFLHLTRAAERLAGEKDAIFRLGALGVAESIVQELRRRADTGAIDLNP